jgi:carbon monoxide dehydrogenase subunit G
MRQICDESEGVRTMAMELTDEFVVRLSVAEAWALLTDLERIAPCLPGARLDEASDGEFKGVVRVKVGPITVEYKGTATFEQLDETSHTLVLKASGRETRGQGNASATVTGKLVGDGATTKVDLRTDLEITGKVAQFGRGVLADVSSKLLGQFVKNLENDLIAAGTSTETAAPATDAAPTLTTAESVTSKAPGSVAPGSVAPKRAAEPEPLNLVRLVGGSIGKRILPGVVLVVFARLVRHLRKRRS